MTEKRIPMPKMTEVATIAGTEKEDAARSLDYIKRLNVQDQKSLEEAVRYVAEVKKSTDMVDERRRGFTSALQQIITDVNDFFRPPLADLTAAEKEIKKKIGTYAQGVEEKRFELVARAGVSLRKGDKDDGEMLLEDAEKFEIQKVPGLSVRKGQELEVTDPKGAVAWCIDNGRTDLLVLNDKALKALLKAEALPEEMPGVTVKPKATVVITASKVGAG